MASKIVHWELMGPDGAVLNDFYREMFGWRGEAVPGFNDYYMVAAEHSGLAGAVGKGSENQPAYLTMYVEVDSIDEQLARIESSGGRTIAPRTVIPNVVTFAMFADPAGNVVGLVEADESPAEG